MNQRKFRRIIRKCKQLLSEPLKLRSEVRPTEVHKDKKKYQRRVKHKKDLRRMDD